MPHSKWVEGREERWKNGWRPNKTLEIIQGLAQAAANAYDGAHDERFSLDGQVRKVGLKREEGCPIMDKRVNDGFSVKFYGNKMCIHYQSDIRLKEVHGGGFEDDIVRQLNEIKKFLQKEYKAITGKLCFSYRSWRAKDPCSINISCAFFCSGLPTLQSWWIKEEPYLEPSVDQTSRRNKKFLEQVKNKRPQNDKHKER